DNIPYGPNFVVRAREQREFIYDLNFGRKKAAGRLGEETAVLEAILGGGAKGRWVPDAVVEHWIPKERQTIKYLRSYYTLLGRTQYYQYRHQTDRLRRARSWLWCKAFCAEIVYRCARFSGDPHRRLNPLVEAAILRGALRR